MRVPSKWDNARLRFKYISHKNIIYDLIGDSCLFISLYLHCNVYINVKWGNTCMETIGKH